MAVRAVRRAEGRCAAAPPPAPPPSASRRRRGVAEAPGTAVHVAGLSKREKAVVLFWRGVDAGRRGDGPAAAVHLRYAVQVEPELNCHPSVWPAWAVAFSSSLRPADALVLVQAGGAAEGSAEGVAVHGERRWGRGARLGVALAVAALAAYVLARRRQ